MRNTMNDSAYSSIEGCLLTKRWFITSIRHGTTEVLNWTDASAHVFSFSLADMQCLSSRLVRIATEERLR